jgi:hypothetical protein
MIPFEEIDRRLEAIGKNRAWLAENTPYSADYLRTVLAPKSTRRTERVLQIISDAIEREEARQEEEQRTPFEAPPEIPAGHTAIYLTGQLYEDAERASRIVDAPTLAAFCHDVIQTQARLIIAKNKGKGNGTNG